MRNGVRALSFRAKVVLIAALLVVGIQLGTLVPVLSSIRERQESEAFETVDRAGNAFAVFMENRFATQAQVASVVIADYGFRGAIGTDDQDEIADRLRNHAAREVGS